MTLDSRIISFIISFFITLISSVICWGAGFLNSNNYLPVVTSIFLSSWVFNYITLEFLIFREINKIYSILDRLKMKEQKNVQLTDFKTKNLPIKRKKLYEEVYTYVAKKQSEINELKKVETFRREFMADISHELKTPIFAAQGFIHTLLDGAMNDKDIREKFLKKAAKSLDGMQEMVEEMLLLSKLESRELPMYMDDFDIVALTKDVFEMLEKKAEKRNVSLRFSENFNGMAVYVLADSYQIKQALKNLVENAINYGVENGKVVVGLDIDKENVVVSVKDDGPGIAPDHLKRIFERFYRVEKSRSKEKGGSGLGLAIVQEIIEAHNSKVLVTSKLGKGTTFAFILKKGVKNDKI
ncbi:MAG: ATP-binding protein [Bacteroidota bacterium]|nr:ATP-binding protein [Bacteroidota bacterium]